MSYAEREELIIEQYQNSSNLAARIELHKRFSTAREKWPLWVFEQLDLPPTSRILDLGCGTGIFWQDNLARIPAGWSIALSDRSTGMTRRARASVKRCIDQFTFTVADAGDIPFADGRFDAVVANHILYHVADLGKTLLEISRVLKPGGRLYTTTNGKNHLRELDKLTPDFIPQRPAGQATASFTLENGTDLLQPFFPSVEQRRFQDGLLVTEALPLVNYRLSRLTLIENQTHVTDSQKQAFTEHIAEEIRQQRGAIQIIKDAGLFIASMD